MRSELSRTTLVVAIVTAMICTAAGMALLGVSGVTEEPIATPDEELQVTCYKWIENDTARVWCPDRVYSPDAWVNITVIPCSDYEYKIDEGAPCSNNLSSP